MVPILIESGWSKYAWKYGPVLGRGTEHGLTPVEDGEGGGTYMMPEQTPWS